MNVFTTFKKFNWTGNAVIPFALGITSLIVVLRYLAADYFFGVKPEESISKCIYEVCIFFLYVTSFSIFCLGNELIGRIGYWDDTDVWITTGISGCVAGIGCAYYMTIMIEFMGLEAPANLVWYWLIPGALYLSKVIILKLWNVRKI